MNLLLFYKKVNKLLKIEKNIFFEIFNVIKTHLIQLNFFLNKLFLCLITSRGIIKIYVFQLLEFITDINNKISSDIIVISIFIKFYIKNFYF